MRLFIRNQSGFGLLETMIAGGLAVTVGLFIAQLMQNMGKESKRVEVRSEAQVFCGQIQSLFCDWEATKQTFGPTTNISTIQGSNSLNLAAVRKGDGTTVYTTGYETPNKSLRLESIRVSSFNSITSTSGQARLQIYLRNLKVASKASAGTEQIKPCELGLNIAHNAAGVITGGVCLNNGVKGIWDYTTDGNGIFYNTGGVEIGSDNNLSQGALSLAVGAQNTIPGSNVVAVGTSNSVSAAASSSLLVGSANTITSNAGASIIGGWSNQYSGTGAVFLFGQNNVAGNNAGKSAAIGWNNSLQSTNTYLIGTGHTSTATTNYSLGLGLHTNPSHTGSTVMGAQSTGVSLVPSTGVNTFTARYHGGYTLYTDETMTPTNRMTFAQGLLNSGRALTVGTNLTTSTTASAVASIGDGNNIQGTTGSALAVGWGNTIETGVGAVAVIGQGNTIKTNASKSIVAGWNNILHTGNAAIIGWASSLNANADYSIALGVQANGQAAGTMTMADYNSVALNNGVQHSFAARYTGGFRFYTNTSHTQGSQLTAGTWTTVSDKNQKEKFKKISVEEILQKIMTLPLEEWSYKGHPDRRHIGTYAQDFHQAFRLNGKDNKSISTVDMDGVLLGGIQALKNENEMLKKRIEKLEKIISEKL